MIACGPYRDDHPVAHALHRWKYGSDPEAGVVLLRHFAERLKGLPVHYDMVVPVPLHPWKLRSRGFNQAAELAHRLTRARPETGPFRRSILSRRRGAVQARLTRVRRIRNAESTFYVRREIPGAVVLLVDDVLTSGATANACARVLLRAGAASVDVAVLARAGRTR